MQLDQLPARQPARISSIDWPNLKAKEAQRLRELGFDEGVLVESLHRGPMGSDPIAFKVGRMTVAIRRSHAATVTVIPEAA